MLLINEKEYDLGTVKFGNITEKYIPITNPSNYSITINPIGSSCSCTTGTVETNPIPANSVTQARINFNSNKVGKGNHTKSYTISWLYNGKHHSHTIRFKVHVN